VRGNIDYLVFVSRRIVMSVWVFLGMFTPQDLTITSFNSPCYRVVQWQAYGLSTNSFKAYFLIWNANILGS